jgi:hypothetical protein
LTSTTDSCCQRAEVHRWETQPGHVAAYYLSIRFYFLSKRFYILDTCVIFLRLFHSAFISFHSAFIFAKELCSSFSKCKKALYHSAFIQIFLSAGKRFIISLSINFFEVQASAYFLF